MGCYADYIYRNSKLLTFLWKVFNRSCEIIGFQLYDNGIFISGPCILINIFHILILTRKPLRNSPIYVIMTAIALIDICSVLFDVHREVVNLFKILNICYSKETDYKIIWLEIFMDCFRNFTRRCSTWLSFSITLIRTFIVRNPLNPRFGIFSKPKIAYLFITGVLVLCAPIHIFDLYKFKIVLDNKNYKFTQYPETNIIFYSWETTELFWDHDDAVYTMHKLLDGLISKIIPCVLYPIATILLVQGIRKAGRQRKKMVSSSSTANSKDASKLVLATTLTFFFAELPLGIIYMLDPFAGFKMKGFDMQVVLSTLFQLFSIILTVTTATHMIICLLISTEYRKTCLVIIRCGYVPKTKKQTQFVALNTKT